MVGPRCCEGRGSPTVKERSLSVTCQTGPAGRQSAGAPPPLRHTSKPPEQVAADAVGEIDRSIGRFDGEPNFPSGPHPEVSEHHQFQHPQTQRQRRRGNCPTFHVSDSQIFRQTSPHISVMFGRELCSELWTHCPQPTIGNVWPRRKSRESTLLGHSPLRVSSRTISIVLLSSSATAP